MRNNFKLIFSIFIFSIISFTSIQALTITWLGGNSDWTDPTQWDTGTVPSSGDDVIIPSGYVYIYGGTNAYARSVEIQSASARLYIYDDGSLEISGAIDNDALHNMGRVYIYGDLYINAITQTNPAFSAKAIKNDRYIFTYPSSQINIKYIDDDAIYNGVFSYMRIRGGLWIYSVDNRAIYNRDRFVNYGSIDIADCGELSNHAIVNSDYFYNASSGVVNVNTDAYGSFSNTNTSARIRNYGSIFTEESSIGIFNKGTLTNYESGVIETRNSTIGYLNWSSGTMTNHGHTKSYDCIEGVNNYGDIVNHYKFYTFYYTGNNGGIRNFTDGKIDNYDDMYINGAGYRSLANHGEFNNYEGSILEVTKVIDIKSTGDLDNRGFIASHAENNHIINGVLTNNGAIDDNFGTMPTAVDNQKIIVAPISGMTEGVAFPNVLDVASLTGFTIGNWKVSQTGASAGSYDETTNEFTPNVGTAGLTTIYIEIEENVSGFNRNFSLEIDGGILTAGGSNMVIQNNPIHTSEDKASKDISLFPNPTSGTVQIKSDLFETQTTQIQVFNTLGQLVQQDQLDQGDFTQKLNLSDQLTNGIYFIKLIQNGEEISTQRIQLQR